MESTQQQHSQQVSIRPPLEVAIIEKIKIQDLQCAICLNILVNPKQCKNGHLFCESCISQSLENKSQCPACRCFLTEKDLSRALFVEKHLHSLSVWCMYHFKYDNVHGEWMVDEEGCKFSGELQSMTKHEELCGFVYCECIYSKNCKLLRKKDLEEHKLICEYRPVDCSYCHNLIQFCKLMDHQNECLYYPLACELCGRQTIRSDMEIHIQKSCPEYLFTCPYGCKEKVIRKNLKSHLQENIVDHFENLRLIQLRELQNMENVYQKELRKRDKEIQNLKRRARNETKLYWVIEGWSRSVQQGYISSKKFDLGGCKWFFGLYPDGDIADSKGYLAMYLFLEKPPPKGKNLMVEFRITIINHKNPKDFIRKELKTTFPLKENQPGWGDRRIAKTSLITEDTGFILNDTLRVECDIIIKQVSFMV